MEGLLEFLTVFFLWLLRSTLQVSILICLVLVVKLLVGNKMPASWHHFLWLLIVVRMLMPWTVSSRFSLFNLFSSFHLQPQVESASPYATEASSDAVSDFGFGGDIGQNLVISNAGRTIDTVTPVSPDEETSANSPLLPKAQDEALSGDAVGGKNVTASVEPRNWKQISWNFKKVLSVIWLAGFAGLGAYVCGSNLSIWRTVRCKRLMTGQKVLDLLEDCRAQMGIRTLLGVVETDKVRSPVLFGCFRPRLLLPVGIIEILSPEELRYVFLHELAHVKRRDIFFGWLASVLSVLHWFNPLVWYAFYRMRVDRELACDGLALSTMNVDEPQKYGRTIVNLLERFSQARYIPGMVGILESKLQLERRITMIAEFKKESRKWKLPAVLIILLLVFVGLTDGRTGKSSGGSVMDRVPAELKDNLLLYYSFQEDTGEKLIDISGMGRSGQVHGARYQRDELLGGAMSFDGQDDFISVPEVRLGEFSFSAWVKTPLTGGAANNRFIFTLDDGMHHYALQGNFGGGLSIVSNGEKINEYDWQFGDNAWEYLTLTHKGGTFKLYKNGALTETGTLASNSVAGTLCIGGTSRHGGGFWRGMIGEVTIFNRALSETEVRQLYDKSGPPGEVSPKPPIVTGGTLGPARFAGVWSGMAVDKPEDGTSRDPLTIKMAVDENGQLAGEAFGSFVSGGHCRLENLKVAGSQISLEVTHRLRNMRMGINLALRDGKLQGAGIPIGIDENRCDITLERKSSAGPGEYTTPMLGIREAILYYSFDRDEEQKVTDQSGKGHHGSVQGAWFEAEGRIGGAMSFDGLNDYITVREVKLEKFSFSAWVKCSTSGRGVNNRRIFTMDDGLHYYALQGNLRGSLSIIFDDQEINTSVCKFEADSWKHLTLTHEAGNFKLYENGVLIQSGHLASSPVSGILCIGGRERHHGSYWQGMIDEVVLFNRALSEAGVKHLYENQLDKIEFLPRKLSVEPEIQPRPEVTGGLERFTGLWSGMAADKPEDGHSRDQLVLNLKVDEKGQLVGQAFGAFVQNGYCELKDLKVVSDQISFKVIHRTSIGMAISLRLRNVELKGEGVPIGGDKQSDRCDIILERKSAGQSAPVATGVKKKR